MHLTCPQCKRYVKFKKRRGEHVCSCGYVFDVFEFYDKYYLVDSNIIIYHREQTKKAKACKTTLNQKDIAITDKVYDEVSKKLPVPDIKIFKTGELKEEIATLSTNRMKQPSEVDLSLVQVAVFNPQIIGIITYDYDFKNIATAGLVNKRNINGPQFWIGNAHEYLYHKRIWKK